MPPEKVAGPMFPAGTPGRARAMTTGKRPVESAAALGVPVGGLAAHWTPAAR